MAANWRAEAVGNTAQLGVTVGAAETDNVSLVRTGAQSQTVATAGVDFELKREGPRLTTDVKGDFNYLDYLQGAYNNQLVGRFDGNATLALLPESLDWVVADSFGRAQLDPLVPPTPTNLEDVNVASMGPELRLWLGLANFLQLGGRYVLVHYETSPFDSKRTLGNLAFGHRLSEHAKITLNAEFESLRFDNTLVTPNYDRRRLYAGYEIQGARTKLITDAGVAQYNQSGRWTSSLTGELDLTRVLSPASKLTLSLGRQYTDAAGSFPSLRTGAAGGVLIAPAAGTASNYLGNYGSSTWRFEYRRTAISASGRWERDTYAGAPQFDVTRAEVALSIERRLSPLLTGELLGSFDRASYANQNFTDNDSLVGAAITLHSARRVEVKLRFNHLQRTASGAATGYTDNQAFLTVTYRIQKSRGPDDSVAPRAPIS